MKKFYVSHTLSPERINETNVTEPVDQVFVFTKFHDYSKTTAIGIKSWNFAFLNARLIFTVLECIINSCVSPIKQHWKKMIEIPQKCDFLTKFLKKSETVC